MKHLVSETSCPQSDVQRLPNCRDEDQDLHQTFGLETGEAEIVAYRLKSRPIIWPQDRVQTFDLETRARERSVSGAEIGAERAENRVSGSER